MTAAHIVFAIVAGVSLALTAWCAITTARQFHQPWWLRKPAGDSVAQALTDAEELTSPPDPWPAFLDAHPELENTR